MRDDSNSGCCEVNCVGRAVAGEWMTSMSSSFSDNSGMIWSGGGRVFRQARLQEREGGHSMSVSAEVVFFRVRVRGERLSEARGKTVEHVSLSTETLG